MKKPIITISTDWHLNYSNTEQIKYLITQQCELTKSLGLTSTICLGDIFDKRAGQKIEELCSIDEILDIFTEYKIELYAIPGNHDKQNYDSPKSFLQPYKHHPNFHYIDLCYGLPIDGIMFHLLPFFKEDVWLKKLHELIDYIEDFSDKKHILLSHQALNGSKNNDGTNVANNISVSEFIKFDKVLLGHYHNQQQVGTNIYHIPAIRQKDFGEDNQKGFIVVYNDGSFELVKSKFIEFEVVQIDFDKISKKDYLALQKQYSNSDKNIRFEFYGSTENVKAINKDELVVLGIDAKIKIKGVEESITEYKEEVIIYNKDNIIDKFISFCKEKEIDQADGIIYLKEKLNGK